ncbi:MAG: UDP-N-acetylmuramoyl-L-alanyl-D-glutamate--2,6-diaminopimelate ligase [Clostridia bacterium]|nr:UDP-N-acetylmuramoyl-L-alanyl-D-glutamate--2,6-diaminopimelate ligase [Clostridia bacterium]
MLLGKLLGAADILCPKEYENIEVDNIVTDSRKATIGSVFVCLKGRSDDGHAHIDEAIKAGASVIVAERMRDECVGGAAIIYCDNTRHAISRLYNYRFGEPTKKMKMVGVTGTNGKTSVTEMLRWIFFKSGYKAGSIGTLGSFLGNERLSTHVSGMTTPEPEELYRTLSLMAEEGAEIVFMEVSSHSLVEGRVDAIEFDTAVFTNLTRDHLDFHKDIEEYFLAKLELFKKSRRGVVNVGAEFGKRVVSEAFCPIFTCSDGVEGDFLAENIKMNGSESAEYDMVCSIDGCERSRVFIPMAGKFAIINSLEALAVAKLFEVDTHKAILALSEFQGVSGRMERVVTDTDSDLDVFIDYAHTPDALEGTLRSAREFRRDGQKITLLFGCGGDRDRGKRKEMGRIASSLADLVIVTSDNPRSEDKMQIISDILKGIDKEKPYTVIADRETAIKTAIEFAREGEMVILAGKGHEKYEINSEGKHSFDEYIIALASMKRRYEKHKKG